MYKKYDQSIKELIIKTGNINAFPELNIPRTTALYWIQKSKKTIKSEESLNRKYQKEILNLKSENNIKYIEICFLKEILKVTKKRLTKSIETTEILNIIKSYKGHLSISKLCTLSNIQESQYYRLINPKNNILLSQTRPNQLTANEQFNLIKPAKDPSLNHLSIKQLQLYAFRKNILHCHYDTWRKYIKHYYPRQKPHIKQKKNNKTKELPVKENHTWHIDITYFKGINGKPLYLQVIIDSYSRAVISWNITQKRSKEVTLQTLTKAFLKNKNGLKPKFLIMDAGKENVNFKVKEKLIQNNTTRIIATKKQNGRNAKIEAFFNVLKSRYINKYKHYSVSNLENEISHALYLYNNSPSSHFYGATPLEVMAKNINFIYLKEELSNKQKYARIQRIKIYNKEVIHS